MISRPTGPTSAAFDGPDVDPVNHPQHYRNSSGVECITVVETMTFNVGNAVKYLWRHGDKGNPIQDLEKARWYVDREIQRLRAEAAEPPAEAKREGNFPPIVSAMLDALGGGA